MGRKEHHERIPGQNQNGHLRNSQILNTRLDLGFYSGTTNLSHTHIYIYVQRSWVYLFRCMEKYTMYISWVYQITQEGQYLSTINLNPKLNFSVNCIKHYVPGICYPN